MVVMAVWPMLVAVPMLVVVVMIVVVIMIGRRFGVVPFADQGPRRRLADSFVEDPPALESAQVCHCFGNCGAAHESFDAIP